MRPSPSRAASGSLSSASPARTAIFPSYAPKSPGASVLPPARSFASSPVFPSARPPAFSGDSTPSGSMSSFSYIPSASAPAGGLSSLPSRPAAPLNDEQTLEMLALGRRCYSLFGQTRWFWSHLKAPYSRQPWLRFHFLQASLLSWLFMASYAVFAVLALSGWLTGFYILPRFWAEGLILLALLVHLILFARLGRQAADGKVPIVPLFGDRALRMAAGDAPLAIWKF